MRTLVQTLSVATFLLVFLTGCSRSDGGPPDEQGSPSATAAPPARESEPHGTQDAGAYTVGALRFTAPQSWRQLTGSDAAATRNEFASGMDLKRYNRPGSDPARMDEFIILQRPDEAQVLAWTLKIPDQTAFTSQILETERLAVAARRSHLKSGDARSITINDRPAVRVDVVLPNGAQTTNLHFWSPEQPGTIATIMIGVRPSAHPDTFDEMQSILASVTTFRVDTPTDSSERKSETTATKPLKSVPIGTKEWTAENLQVSTFRNGDAIPEAKSAEEWKQAYKNESAAWCYYNNDPHNGEKFGKLYNWYAVNDPRGLAPAGWHIPTDDEWQTMIKSLGGMRTAFEKMKDPAGFRALPAGSRWFQDASFLHQGTITFWWSASKKDKWNAWYHAMHFGFKQIGRDNGGMNTGHSVRCVKDDQLRTEKGR